METSFRSARDLIPKDEIPAQIDPRFRIGRFGWVGGDNPVKSAILFVEAGAARKVISTGSWVAGKHANHREHLLMGRCGLCP